MFTQTFKLLVLDMCYYGCCIWALRDYQGSFHGGGSCEGCGGCEGCGSCGGCEGCGSCEVVRVVGVVRVAGFNENSTFH